MSCYFLTRNTRKDRNNGILRIPYFREFCVKKILGTNDSFAVPEITKECSLIKKESSQIGEAVLDCRNGRSR